MKLKRELKNHGLSIIEVLIATAIMGILMAGFASMMSSQNKETKAVAEILSAQDLQKSVIAAMASGDVCHYILSSKNFNANLVTAGTAQEIDLGVAPLYSSMVASGTPGPALIKKGDKASGFTSSLVVDSVKFIIESGVVSGTVGTFNGRWVIGFDSAKSVRALKPVSVAAIITANTTTPTAAVPTSCLGTGSTNMGSGDSDYLAKWASDSSLKESVIYEDPVSGRIGIGTITPSGQLSVSGVLSSGKMQVIDVVAESTACGPDGLVARDSFGVLLSCQTGLWKKSSKALSSSSISVNKSSFVSTPFCTALAETTDPVRLGYTRVFNTTDNSLIQVSGSSEGIGDGSGFHSSYISLFVNGVKCATDRSTGNNSTAIFYASASCSQAVGPGTHTVIICWTYQNINSAFRNVYGGTALLQ